MFDLPLQYQEQLDPLVEHHFFVETSAPSMPLYEIDFHQPSISSIASKHLHHLSLRSLDEDWGLNEFFGNIYLINMPTATERLQKMKANLRKIGVKTFEVFEGINGRKDVDEAIWSKFYCNRDRIQTDTPEGIELLKKLHQGESGCYLSHFGVIKKAKAAFEDALKNLAEARRIKDATKEKAALRNVRKYSRILILEDDCNFGIINNDEIYKRGAGVKLRDCLRELPKDWDMFYFVVGVIAETNQISEHIYKIGKSWSLACYAVNYTMYQPLVDQLKVIEDPLVTAILPVDHQISVIHGLYNVYALYPALAFTDIGPSQISPVRGNKRYWQGQPIYKGKKKKKPDQ